MIKYFLHSLISIDDLIVIDPHDGSSIGLKRPNVKGELVLLTHEHYDHNAYQIVKGYTQIKVKSYESFNFKNYEISGFRTFHDREKGRRRGENTIYSITTPKGLLIVHLGDLGHEIDNEIIEEIKGANLLAIPVGGVITIDANEALRLVNKIKPKLVLPIHYWVPGHYMPLNTNWEFISGLKWKTTIIGEEGIEETTLENNTLLIA
jgi:L-ascorbate metabolism protein UlaG (beta-lactamase superfamily)